MINTTPVTGGGNTKTVESPSSTSSLSIPSLGGRKGSSSSLTSKGSKNAEDPGIVKDVALKVIPKKKVKGNEAAVWGEMEVLKGLDHKNIASHFRTLLNVPPHVFLRSSFTNGSNQGPSTISPLNSQRVESSLSESAREEDSRKQTRLLLCGKRGPKKHP